MRYKSVFISDIHLGTKMSRADKLLDFLKTFECEKLYLVGDIVDGWAMSKTQYWPQHHNDVVQKILRKARKGAEIYYIPGNHDEFLRNYVDTDFGNIHVVNETVHVGIDGKKYLVIHGDQFDAVINNAKWLAKIGSWAYDFSISINLFVHKVRNFFGLPYWSLSSYLKYKVKKAVNFISNYESCLANYAKTKDVDGVICGHIHHPNICDIDDITYINCGDWVESCSAIVEDYEGNYKLIRWSDEDSNSN